MEVKQEKREFESEQIDTSKPRLVKEASRVKDNKMELEKHESLARTGSHLNSDQLRQAQEIFGDDNEDEYLVNKETRAVANLAIEDVFHGDEIDDPFSSAAD
jgi:hypothetical protein